MQGEYGGVYPSSAAAKAVHPCMKESRQLVVMLCLKTREHVDNLRCVRTLAMSPVSACSKIVRWDTL